MVYIAHNLAVTCATCRFSKTNCKHIHHLKDIFANPDFELPDMLQQYAKLILNVLPPTIMKQHQNHSCISNSPIPFDLPINLSAVIRLPHEVRFSMCNGVAELVPPCGSEVCSICCRTSWSEPFFKQEATIITTNLLLPARGMLHIIYSVARLICYHVSQVYTRRCSTQDCPGYMVYDGREQCLLNMNRFIFAYEVLRQFMFHVLLGRYVNTSLE